MGIVGVDILQFSDIGVFKANRWIIWLKTEHYIINICETANLLFLLGITNIWKAKKELILFKLQIINPHVNRCIIIFFHSLFIECNSVNIPVFYVFIVKLIVRYVNYNSASSNYTSNNNFPILNLI